LAGRIGLWAWELSHILLFSGRGICLPLPLAIKPVSVNVGKKLLVEHTAGGKESPIFFGHPNRGEGREVVSLAFPQTNMEEKHG